MKSGLRDLLACPSCHGALVYGEPTITCKRCGADFPLREGVPVLIPPDSPFAPSPEPPHAPVNAGRLPAWVRRFLRPYLEFNPPLTTWIDRSLFVHLNACTAAMWILNLGSGAGLFDQVLAPHLRLIHLDVVFRGHVDVVADAHWLPFADGSLDGVYSNAVLEHVQRPWRVADEIYRVLRPGGRIFINVPFLNIVHDAHDYFRFTDRGLDVLFSQFHKVAGGVSAGPSSFLAPFLIEYVLCGIPGRYFKAAVRPLLTFAVWPLKYLDFLLRRSPSLRLTADAFYFVGVKPA
jgi:uncharacterized protein YbaR (Trm112 family)/SAM-dependent methyltransferase